MNNDENKNDKKTEGDDYVFDFGREEKNDGQAGRETRVPPEVYEPVSYTHLNPLRLRAGG